MRTMLWRGLALAASLAVFAAQGRADETLRVGKAALQATAILPIDVGAQQGLFKQRGVNVEISNFQGASRLHQAMVAGDIDIGMGAGPEMAFIAKGSPELAICNADPKPKFLGLVVSWDSPIKSLDQLKGQKIHIASTGGLTYWLALELARKKGWGPKGITLVTTGNNVATTVSELQTHAVAAAFTATALAFTLELRKQGKLLAPATDFAGNVGAGMIFASDSIMKSHAAAVRDFLAGWLDTIVWIRNHRDEAVKIEAGITHFPLAVQAKEYDLTIDMFSSSCKFDAETLANLKRSFVDLNLVSSPPDMTKLYTEEFIPKRS